MKVGHFRLKRRGQLFGRSQDAPLGYLEFAGWLAPGVLWVDGWLTADSQEPLEVSVTLEGEELTSIQAQRFCFPRADLSEIPGAVGIMLAVPLGRTEADGRHLDALHIRHGGELYRWTGRRGKPIQTDLVARLRHKLTLLPEIRAGLGDFVTERSVLALSIDPSDALFQSHASTVQALGPIDDTDEQPSEADDQPVAEEAAAATEEERREGEGSADDESPPPFMADPDKPLGLCIDMVIATGGDSFFLRGWIWDIHGLVEELEMVSPDGRRRALLDSMVRAERQDVTNLFEPKFGERARGRHGFFGFFDDGIPQGDTSRYRFELRLSDGGSLAAGTPTLITDPHTARDAVFASLPEMRHRDLEMLAEQAHPASERIKSRRQERIAVRRNFVHGTPPPAPEISIVIPVFEHIELIEHQLAQLADDSGLDRCEIIFVLDSRHHEAWLEDVIFYLSSLYQVPIRGIVLAHRSGHAAATNVGVAEARGRLLVLMRADVFPDRPGWLQALADFYDSQQEIGALAPKLLYEDQSLRHAGVDFTKGLEPDDLWSLERFYHGLPRRHPAAQETRKVAAVSGACLMISRDLFERLGGMRDDYFGVDFEDVDLCLRCAEEGLESWYLPAVELFQLDDLSPESDPDRSNNPWVRLYDRWLQTERWDARIRQLKDANV